MSDMSQDERLMKHCTSRRPDIGGRTVLPVAAQRQPHDTSESARKVSEQMVVSGSMAHFDPDLSRCECQAGFHSVALLVTRADRTDGFAAADCVAVSSIICSLSSLLASSMPPEPLFLCEGA